ncbi:MAG: AAA family ATPase [Candidatus Pacearchaeota archaeon]
MSDIELLKERFHNSNNIKDDYVFNIDKDIKKEFFVKRKEVENIQSKLLEFFEIGKRQHLLIYGGVGTGKTKLLKYILDDAHTVYNFKVHFINCRNYNTSYQVMKKIIGEQKKLPADIMFQKFQLCLGKSQKRISNPKIEKKDKEIKIIVLDEVDLLKDDTIFYNITRDEEFSDVLLIMITNKQYFYDNILTNDVKSSLQYQLIVFDAYNATEIIDILLKRCEHGLHNYDKSVVNYIAGINTKLHNSDVRVGIKTCEEIFRKKDFSKISKDELESCMMLERIKIKNDIIKSLTDNKLILLLLIHDISSSDPERICRSNKLYPRYKLEGYDVAKSYFFQYLNELEKLDLLYLIQRREKRSNVLEVHLKLEEENIEKLKEIIKAKGY